MYNYYHTKLSKVTYCEESSADKYYVKVSTENKFTWSSVSNGSIPLLIKIILTLKAIYPFIT